MNSIEFIHNIAKRREPDNFDWEQAKEMHEKEMIEACRKMQIVMKDVDFGGNVTFMFSPEDYYNKTYKK